MGAGAHGGFGHTKGSRSTPRFTRVQYEGTVKVNGDVCAKVRLPLVTMASPSSSTTCSRRSRDPW